MLYYAVNLLLPLPALKYGIFQVWLLYAIFLNLLKLISLMQGILDTCAGGAKLNRPPPPPAPTLPPSWFGPLGSPKIQKNVLGDDPHMPPPPKKSAYKKIHFFCSAYTVCHIELIERYLFVIGPCAEKY